MIKNKINKGDILVYVDEYGNQKAISPDNILVKVGTIISTDNDKKVGTGTYKKLGVVLSELVNDLDTTKKELSEFRADYRANTKTIVSMIEILINQAELNNINIEDLKKIQEEMLNEK